MMNTQEEVLRKHPGLEILGSHQNIGLHTGARANVVLLTYLLTYLLDFIEIENAVLHTCFVIIGQRELNCIYGNSGIFARTSGNVEVDIWNNFSTSLQSLPLI